MDSSYDVAIVGAGPAGLAAAKKCAELELRTLLVEDNAVIGSPVQCGESLVWSAFEDMGIAEPPSEWIANADVHTIHLYSPNMKRFSIKLAPGKTHLGVILERKMFEKGLAVMCAKAGADVFVKTPAVGVLKDGSQVTGIKVNHLGEEMDVKSKIVLGCDGPASNVGRWAGMEVYRTSKTFDSCAQLQMAGVDVSKEIAELYFCEHAPGGAVWILPKSDGFANIGNGVNGADPNTAMQHLRNFVNANERFRDGSIIEVNAGPVPVGGANKQLHAPGIMLVGDAARQVNPITGGGMKFGINAAVVAAGVAKAAIDGNDLKDLAAYQKWWAKEYGKQFKRWMAMRKVIYGMSEKDLDGLFDELGVVEISETDSKKDMALLAIQKIRAISTTRKLKLAGKLIKAMSFG